MESAKKTVGAWLLLALSAAVTAHAEEDPLDQKLAKGLKDDNYVLARSREGVLYRKRGESVSFRSVRKSMIVEPLGAVEGPELVIIGQIGPQTVPWVLDTLAKRPRAGAQCDLKMGKDEQDRMRAENSAILGGAGEIRPAAVEGIARALCGAGIKTLKLHSPGGQVVSSLALGAAVKLAGVDTAIPAHGVCASACNEIFRNGRRRAIGEGATLMFHLPSLDGESVQVLGPSRMALPSSLRQEVLSGTNVFVSSAVAVDLGLADRSEPAPSGSAPPPARLRWACESRGVSSTECSNQVAREIPVCGFSTIGSMDTKPGYCSSSADGWKCSAEAKYCYFASKACAPGDSKVSVPAQFMGVEAILKKKVLCRRSEAASLAGSGQNGGGRADGADQQ